MTRRRSLLAALWVLYLIAGGCANSRPIFVPRARFDPARPERIGREPRRGLPPFRRRQEPMELRVDPPVIQEEEGEIRFEPSDDSTEPPLN